MKAIRAAARIDGHVSGPPPRTYFPRHVLPAPLLSSKERRVMGHVSGTRATDSTTLESLTHGDLKIARPDRRIPGWHNRPPPSDLLFGGDVEALGPTCSAVGRQGELICRTGPCPNPCPLPCSFRPPNGRHVSSVPPHPGSVHASWSPTAHHVVVGRSSYVARHVIDSSFIARHDMAYIIIIIIFWVSRSIHTGYLS